MGIYEIKNLFKRHTTMDFDKASPVNQNARGVPVPSKAATVGTCIFVHLRSWKILDLYMHLPLTAKN